MYAQKQQHYLDIPDFFQPNQVREVYRVPYQKRSQEAENWAKEHGIKPVSMDEKRVALLLIDVQNTFCIPNFELFVGGASGMGAVEDNVRLCEFIYRNLAVISEIIPTMDSHTAMQIFHPIFWVNDAGNHPEPATIISLADVQQGRWKVNPEVSYGFAQCDVSKLAQHALHYVQKLSDDGKYPLTAL